MASRHVVLGILADAGMFASEGKISFAPDGAKLRAMVDSLRRGRKEGRLTPSRASKAFGLCNFVLSAVGGRVGRAACQPLIQRTFRDSDVGWSEALESMLCILEAVLLPQPPHLVVDLARVWDRHLVTASDACFEKRVGGLRALGIVLWDAEKRGGFFASQVVPQWILAKLDLVAETLIMQLEMLAVVCLYLTFGRFMQGRRVLHGVDNSGVLKTILTGWNGKPDMARLGTMLTSVMTGIDGDQWFYWVASKANIADIPSRPDFRGSAKWDTLRELGLVEIPMVLPSEELWENPAGISG